MAPRCISCQSSWQARAGTPEEGSVEDDDEGDNKSSCCVTARLHFGPCFSICLFRSSAVLSDFPCMSCLLTWHVIKCCFTSVCGAWRVRQELVNQGNRNKHSIRSTTKKNSLSILSAYQFPVQTCSLLMKFSHLFVHSHSSCVGKYNYTKNACSSFCLSAVYSVRSIIPEAEEMISQCLYLYVSLPDCV